MNLHKLTMLVSNIKATDCMQHLTQQVRAIAPHALIVTNEDLKTDPSVIGRVEIAFGALPAPAFFSSIFFSSILRLFLSFYFLAILS